MKNSGTNKGRPIPKKLPQVLCLILKHVACIVTMSSPKENSETAKLCLL